MNPRKGRVPLPERSLAGLVMARAKVQPDVRAIATMEDSISHGELVDLVACFAAHMRRHGVTGSSRLVINLPHGIVATAAALACSLLGCCWTSGAATAEEFSRLRLTHALAMEPGAWVDSGLRVVLVGPNWMRPPPGPPGPRFTGSRSSAAIWQIGRSSGTTGTPKFMALSEAYVWDRVAREPFYLDLPERPVVLCLFPPLAGAGIRATLRVLAMGGTILFARLSRVYGTIAIDCVFGSPSQFSQFLAAAPSVPDPAARIAGAAMVGAAAGRGLLEQMLRYFAAVGYGYASTEASTVCSNVITSAEDLPDGADPIVSVGRPRPDVRVEIVNEEGQPLPAGTEGIIRVRTPRHVPGYLGEPELSEQVFRDGWFYPGDMGYLDDIGELRITGRVNDLFNIGGEKLHPERIDNLVRGIPGIRDCASFLDRDAAGAGRIAVAVVLDGSVSAQSIAVSLNGVVTCELGPVARVDRIHLMDDIPRNATGKVARRDVADLAPRTVALPLT